MKDLIALTRMMNLYYHHLHNITQGPCFSADHELMSDFYTQLEDSYDSLIERYIGTGNECGKECLLEIITEAHKVLESIPDGNDMDTHLYHSIALEDSLRSELESAAAAASFGTQDLLQSLASESEVRVYKLKQRVK